MNMTAWEISVKQCKLSYFLELHFYKNKVSEHVYYFSRQLKT